MTAHPHPHEDGRQPLPLVGQTGAEKVAEASDPYVATAVSLATPGYDGLEAMARAFVEEFALMGWPRHRILRLFASPSFAGAHMVYRERGAQYIEALVDDVLGTGETGEEG